MAAPAAPAAAAAAPAAAARRRAAAAPAPTAARDAAKLIYVIDQDNTLSSFKPDQTDITKSVFTDIGKLSCNAGGSYQPFSMSVDRTATAWVEYVNQLAGLGGASNKLFKVSTADASCTATTFAAGQQGFNEFGMGFVANSSGSTDETLFIAGGGSVGGASNLGTLDVGTLMITKGNSLSGDPELTGTGLGDLWGFFPVVSGGGGRRLRRAARQDHRHRIEQHDLARPAGTGQASAWAFGFYGGDFWVFLAQGSGATTVYHVTMTGVKDSLDTMTRHIVGAGVSTCAPTTPIG